MVAESYMDGSAAQAILRAISEARNALRDSDLAADCRGALRRLAELKERAGQ